MRHMVFALVSLIVVGTGTASAQTMPSCNRDVAVVRISQLTPASSMVTFMKAQDAHLA